MNHVNPMLNPLCRVHLSRFSGCNSVIIAIKNNTLPLVCIGLRILTISAGGSKSTLRVSALKVEATHLWFPTPIVKGIEDLPEYCSPQTSLNRALSARSQARNAAAVASLSFKILKINNSKPDSLKQRDFEMLSYCRQTVSRHFRELV